MSPNHDDTFRESVLADFVTVDGSITEDRLRDFSKRYPELTKDFTELAQELALMEKTPWPDAFEVDEEAGRNALARFADIEAEIGKRQRGRQAVPFEGFTVKDYRAVAANLGVNTSFVQRLRDRLIEVEDFSNGLLEAIAAAVGTNLEAMKDFLAGVPPAPATRMFKADEKPSYPAKQSLQQALDDSGLDEDQKHRLLSL